MDENHLLELNVKKPTKKYVIYRRPEGPLRLLEIDIRSVWIDAARQHGYVLTVLDVFTR